MSELKNTHNPRYIAIKRDHGYAGTYIDLNCLETCDLAFGEYVIYRIDEEPSIVVKLGPREGESE